MITPIEQLRQQKIALRKEFSQLDNALATGKITSEEYAYYLNQQHGGKQEHQLLQELERQEAALLKPRNEHHHIAYMVSVFFVVSVLIGYALLNPAANPTGFVTGPTAPIEVTSNQTFTNSTSILVNITGTGLTVRGNHTGELLLEVIQNGTTYVLYNESTAPERPYITPRVSAIPLNSSLNFSVVPAANATYWVINPNGTRQLADNSSFENEGTYTIDAIINESGNVSLLSHTFIVTETVNETVIVEETKTFETCGEACDLEIYNATLNITMNGTFSLSSMATTVARENIAPNMTDEIPDVTVLLNTTTTINLAEHFMDADNDTLTYDFMEAPGVTLEVSGNRLYITGTTAGEYESLIYASDLYRLAQSNVFTITVQGSGSSNSTEANVTQNQTRNTTENTTQESTNQSMTNLSCSNPDPNKRPLGCLQEEAEVYFRPQSIVIEDLDRNVVGRFTPIGNLLIIGEVYEYSVETPDNRVFQVLRNEGGGRTAAVAWIDNDGNLHLTGQLYEEELSLTPPRGAYSIQNSESITVGYVDKENGDLHIRGNVIPFRRQAQLEEDT